MPDIRLEVTLDSSSKSNIVGEIKALIESIPVQEIKVDLNPDKAYDTLAKIALKVSALDRSLSNLGKGGSGSLTVFDNITEDINDATIAMKTMTDSFNKMVSQIKNSGGQLNGGINISLFGKDGARSGVSKIAAEGAKIESELRKQISKIEQLLHSVKKDQTIDNSIINLARGTSYQRSIGDWVGRASSIANEPDMAKRITFMQRYAAILKEIASVRGVDLSNLGLTDVLENAGSRLAELESGVDAADDFVERLKAALSGGIGSEKFVAEIDRIIVKLDELAEKTGNSGKFENLITELQNVSKAVNEIGSGDSKIGDFSNIISQLETLNQSIIEVRNAINEIPNSNGFSSLVTNIQDAIAAVELLTEEIMNIPGNRNPPPDDPTQSYLARLRELYNLARQVDSVLGEKYVDRGSASYASLSNMRNGLTSVLDEAEQANGAVIDLGASLSRVGLGGNNGLNQLRTTMAQVKEETSSTAAAVKEEEALFSSVAKMRSQINSTLSSKSGLAGTADYQELQRISNALGNVMIDAQGAQNGLADLRSILAAHGFTGQTWLDTIKNQLDSFNSNASAGKLAPLVRDTKEYNAALTQANTLLNTINTNSSKWTAAQNGTAVADYTKYTAQAPALRQLIADIEAGNVTAAEFDRRISEIKLHASEAAEAISRVGENTKVMTPITQGTREYANALRQIESLTKEITINSQKWSAARNGKSADSYSTYIAQLQQLESLTAQLQSGQMTPDSFATAFSAISSKATEAANAIRVAGENTRSFGDRLKGVVSKFSMYFGTSQVVMYTIQTFRQMVTASIELDSALAQLQIVTGATDAQMKQFSNTAVNLAKDLGQSVTGVLGSIETFSRLGYNLADATQLSKFAGIMSNVAGVGVDEATTGMTSIIKGYNMSVENSEHVADVLIEVGQKYAVSAGEMMTAYEKSSAALNATNTSFEKSAGLIAAANAAVECCRAA